MSMNLISCGGPECSNFSSSTHDSFDTGVDSLAASLPQLLPLCLLHLLHLLLLLQLDASASLLVLHGLLQVLYQLLLLCCIKLLLDPYCIVQAASVANI